MYQTALLLAALSATPTQGYYGCYASSQVRHVTASVKGSRITVRDFAMSPVVREEFQRVPVKTPDGKVEFREVRVTTFQMMANTIQRQYDADKVRFLDNEQAKVPAGIALARLENETPALAVHDERVIDPAHVSLLKPGTLILILPVDPPPGPNDGLKPLPVPKTGLPRDQSFASLVGDPKKSDAPTGPPPVLVRASIDAKGIAHLQEISSGTETAKVKVAKDAGGFLKEMTVEMQIARTMTTTRSIDAEFVKGYNVFGKELDARTLAQKLQKPTAVLASTDGKAVDPYYLQIYQEGTIILVAPSPYPVAPVMPVPTPKRPPVEQIDAPKRG